MGSLFHIYFRWVKDHDSSNFLVLELWLCSHPEIFSVSQVVIHIHRHQTWSCLLVHFVGSQAQHTNIAICTGSVGLKSHDHFLQCYGRDCQSAPQKPILGLCLWCVGANSLEPRILNKVFGQVFILMWHNTFAGRFMLNLNLLCCLLILLRVWFLNLFCLKLRWTTGSSDELLQSNVTLHAPRNTLT